MNKVLVLYFGLLLATAAGAAPAEGGDTVDLHVRSSGPRRAMLAPAVADAMQTGTFQQATDHFGKAPNQTFSQRYWYDSEFASGPDAPVLYHMCGETDVDGAYFLTDNVLAWAKQLGARVVFLEHRYYGQSLPFTDLANDHMQFLTFSNVMEDLAGFQKWLTASQGWTGKWIAVGGSYSATMAAVYRQQHPELVVGALASSGPMISGIGSAVDGPGDAEGISSPDPAVDGSDRSWAYQSCTEFGFWQAEGAGRGSQLDLPGPALCQAAFGTVPHFDSTAYNAAHDLPFLANGGAAPSNILFTYGSDDVWTDIGLATQQNANTNITILMIDGAGHHFDLNAADGSDSAAVTDARAEFVTLAKTWLGEG